ncbi:MAG TPA: UvrD-helicase domain-containing protein [Terriglobia bacterium]|nr:UvrD-helicase domain-containing protein [Terriglobia bacterium]
MASLLDELNPQQRAAAEATEGPLLILAGAGSGKTRVITYRVAYLIETKQVLAENILAVTFTNKAAEQMKERIAGLLASRGVTCPRPPLISTFHSFCVRVLRRSIDRLGYTREFSIYDEDAQLRVVKASTKELGLSEQITSPRGALSQISYAKNHGITPPELYRDARSAESAKLASVFDLYERKLRQANALDFDDLLLKTAALLDSAGDICRQLNERFRYILVDEYQDTNRIQYELIRQLTRSHRNLCVVGDEDQSIYRWRGATIENILQFEKDYPGARVVRLEQNYRSTQAILDAAGAVVQRNTARKGKTLWTDRGGGARVSLFEAASAEEEGAFVAGGIGSALAANDAATIAVLYRTNAQSRVLEEALRRRGVDYRMAGGFSFYARAEVRDVLAYAGLASNLRDSASLTRIFNTPPRGIGDTTVAALGQSARERKLTLWEALEQELAERQLPARALRALQSFHELIREFVRERDAGSIAAFFRNILERTGYLRMLEMENTSEAEGRIENLRELVNAAAAAESAGETLAEFLDRAALVSDSDDYDERARVTLMTLHTAKGLEFSTVYMVGLEEGLFPHKLSTEDQEEIEEERRLCYVGMTRAKDRLILTWAGQRRSFAGESYGHTKRSRFLNEIPAQLIEVLNPRPASAKPRTSWASPVNSRQGVQEFLRHRGYTPGRDRASPRLSFSGPRSAPSRWKLGTQVRHAKYGLGTVVGCEGEGDDVKVTVSFPGYGQKKLVERYADLEKA